MKFNMSKQLLVAALFTGVLCGAWVGFAPMFGLSVWAGFAGCTAYFASGKHKLEGTLITIVTGILGVGTALAMIWLGDNVFSFLSGAAGAVSVGIVVVFIVLCASIDWLSYVPGIFVGCYSLFAINGDWKLLCSSIIAGAILGVACEQGGMLVSKKLGISN